MSLLRFSLSLSQSLLSPLYSISLSHPFLFIPPLTTSSPLRTTKVILDFCSRLANPSLHHIKFLSCLKFDLVWIDVGHCDFGCGGDHHSLVACLGFAVATNISLCEWDLYVLLGCMVVGSCSWVGLVVVCGFGGCVIWFWVAVMVVVVLDGHYVLGVVGCDFVWIAVVGRCSCGQWRCWLWRWQWRWLLWLLLWSWWWCDWF